MIADGLLCICHHYKVGSHPSLRDLAGLLSCDGIGTPATKAAHRSQKLPQNTSMPIAAPARAAQEANDYFL